MSRLLHTRAAKYQILFFRENTPDFAANHLLCVHILMGIIVRSQNMTNWFQSETVDRPNIRPKKISYQNKKKILRKTKILLFGCSVDRPSPIETNWSCFVAKQWCPSIYTHTIGGLQQKPSVFCQEINIHYCPVVWHHVTISILKTTMAPWVYSTSNFLCNPFCFNFDHFVSFFV